MATTAVKVSVVVPAYNEAGRIRASLHQILNFLRTQKHSFEVLVVDDGSTDSTVDIVTSLTEENASIRLVENHRNQGKGFSVRHGAREARGEIVLFTDADLSSPIEDFPKLLTPIETGIADVAIGSRALNQSLIGVHQPWWREQSGRVFNRLVRWILNLKFEDTQCGFKAFRREPMRAVFSRQQIVGFGFDPEILYIAARRGLKIVEVPVRWNHSEGSKVKFLSDALGMFWDLIRIRWNGICGKYDGGVL